MRTEGSPAVLEYRRRLAVQRIEDGYSIGEVADFVGVDPRTVRRWVAAFRRSGAAGLAAHPVPGRPPKLTPTQEKIVGRWLDDNPTEHGFATELWTGPRLALLIEQEFGIRLHPDYLSAWRRRRGYTPQKPRRVHRERDDEAIARWLEQDWPRIKKGAAAGCLPRPDGRERPADGPPGATELGLARPSASAGAEGGTPGEGVGGGGAVADAAA